MPVPSEIIELVNRFREHSESYRLPTYNETQVRRYARTAQISLAIPTDFEEFK